jgi:hypothetical protein
MRLKSIAGGISERQRNEALIYINNLEKNIKDGTCVEFIVSSCDSEGKISLYRWASLTNALTLATLAQHSIIGEMEV